MSREHPLLSPRGSVRGGCVQDGGWVDGCMGTWMDARCEHTWQTLKCRANIRGDDYEAFSACVS